MEPPPLKSTKHSNYFLIKEYSLKIFLAVILFMILITPGRKYFGSEATKYGKDHY
jgi:hypothetical protein